MGRGQIDQLVWLLDQGFEGDPEHSLMANLRHIDGLWGVRGPDGGRSIGEIVRHAGTAKHVYEAHAFGGGTTSFDEAFAAAPESEDEAVAWLRAGHERLRASVRVLEDDEELAAPRMAHWGELMETRVLLKVLIQHDTYHAGEINHLRALLQGNDRWGYFPS